MCFEIHADHSEVKVATEDIVCYKFFTPHTLGVDYFTPFQRVRVPKKSLMESELGQTDLDHSWELSLGIHSLTTLDEALAYRTRVLSHSCKAIYVKCVVPKGSTYYFNPDTNQYVSNKLQLGEEIKFVKLRVFFNNLFNSLK